MEARDRLISQGPHLAPGSEGGWAASWEHGRGVRALWVCVSPADLKEVWVVVGDQNTTLAEMKQNRAFGRAFVGTVGCETMCVTFHVLHVESSQLLYWLKSRLVDVDVVDASIL